MSEFHVNDRVTWRNNALPEGVTVDEWPPVDHGVVTELKPVQVGEEVLKVALITTADELTWWVLTRDLTHE